MGGVFSRWSILMVASDFLAFLNMLILLLKFLLTLMLVLFESRCWLSLSLKLCNSADIRGWLIIVMPSSVSRFSLDRMKLLLTKLLVKFLSNNFMLFRWCVFNVCYCKSDLGVLFSSLVKLDCGTIALCLLEVPLVSPVLVALLRLLNISTG